MKPQPITITIITIVDLGDDDDGVDERRFLRAADQQRRTAGTGCTTAGNVHDAVQPAGHRSRAASGTIAYGIRRPNAFEHLVEVLAPRDRDRGCADGVLEHQVPADDPRDQLAHRRVGVGVGAARDRDHRRELGVAQSGEGAAEAGDDEGQGDRRTGAVGDCGRRPDEEAGADDRADAERDQRDRPQRPFQRAFSGGPGFGQQPIDRLGSKRLELIHPPRDQSRTFRHAKRRIIPATRSRR